MIHAEIAIDGEEARRREHRFASGAAFTLLGDAEPALEAELLNISSGGFMAETAADLSPGTRISMRLPGGDRVEARVLWAEGHRVGGEFAELVDPLEIIHAAGARQVL